LVRAQLLAFRTVDALEQGGDDAFLSREFGLEFVDFLRERTILSGELGDLLLGRFDAASKARTGSGCKV